VPWLLQCSNGYASQIALAFLFLAIQVDIQEAAIFEYDDDDANDNINANLKAAPAVMGALYTFGSLFALLYGGGLLTGWDIGSKTSLCAFSGIVLTTSINDMCVETALGWLLRLRREHF